jgi:hypothetical protein
MTGYIILGIIIFWALSLLGAFVAGYTKGRQREMMEQTAATLRKAASDKDFEIQKEKIKEEVFGNAKKKKSKLSSSAGRERFNAVNDSLRNTNKS